MRRGRIVEATGQEAFPGMQHRVAKKPPKAEAQPEPMTLDEAIARTSAIMDRVIAQYGTGEAVTEIRTGKRAGTFRNYGPREIEGIYGLFSGGNDSVVANHVLLQYLDGIIHINTGTAIRRTTEHVRAVVPTWSLPLHELRPKVSYRDLVLGRVLSTRGKNKGRPVWIGFPGPGKAREKRHSPHDVMRQRLKVEPLESFRTSRVGRDGARKKVLYISGTRWDESDSRFRQAGEVTEQGGMIWVAALVHWTNEHMDEYRARHRCREDHEHEPDRLCFPGALPLNPVTRELHASGDCTCGSYAHPGEKEEIRFWHPERAEELDALEAEAEAGGIPACKWGQRPPPGVVQMLEDVPDSIPLTCAGCIRRPTYDQVLDGFEDTLREDRELTARLEAQLTPKSTA